jgi:hypothetical protein
METTAFTINFNTNKVDEITARRVIAARAALAEAKAEAEKAEDAFRALNTDAVILDDGTKVAIVEQSRRTINQSAAKDVLPEGQHQRLTKRVVQQPLVDEAVEGGWLKQAVVDTFTKVTHVRAVKVTQPK